LTDWDDPRGSKLGADGKARKLSGMSIACATNEQRSQTRQIAPARRVALLFRLSGVAPHLQIHQGYAPSSRLAQAKNQQ